jgi:uncharacterized protein (TIGR00369 family)
MDKKIINPDWLNMIKKRVNASPYFGLQQMSIKDITWGHSIIEIDIYKGHLQPFGLVHGGVFASLLDASAFWAVYSQAQPDMGMTTVELSINYLAGATSGRLIASGQCLKLGRTIGLGQSQINDENGKLLASGKVTLMLLKGKALSDNTTTPVPKFL